MQLLTDNFLAVKPSFLTRPFEVEFKIGNARMIESRRLQIQSKAGGELFFQIQSTYRAVVDLNFSEDFLHFCLRELSEEPREMSDVAIFEASPDVWKIFVRYPIRVRHQILETSQLFTGGKSDYI